MFFAAIFIASPANAFNGEQLLGYCTDVIKYQQDKSDKSPSRFYNMGLCYGFISGVVNNHKIMFQYRKVPKLFCTPEQITIAEIAVIFVKDLEKNPQNLQINGALLLDGALKDAFPCPKQLKPIK